MIWRSGPLADETTSVLIVGIEELEVEAMLVGGVGPVLAGVDRCPDCDGLLGGWGSYPRAVRGRGETRCLRVHRARCRECGRTHALLPSFLYGRRRDLAEVIFAGLRMGAEGGGYRRVAAAAGVPDTTARGWLRRGRSLAELGRRHFAVLAGQLGAPPGRAPPTASALGALLEAIAAAHRAASERFGAAAALSPWAFSSAARGGWLLANTGAPLAAAGSR